jgi:hypothetical protein
MNTQEKDWKDGLLIIEGKYPKYTQLENHLIMLKDDNGIPYRFHFKENPPKELQEEVINLFARIYL